MSDQRLGLLVIAGGILLSSCTWVQLPGANPSGSSPSPAPTGSPASCEPAPAWLIAVIQEGIVVRGATLSNMYVTQASGLSGGPAELKADAFASAWWVAGRINGAGVRPELAVWLTNRTAQDEDGEILAVDAAAQRYSEWGRDSVEPIRGEGLEEVRSCVGPIPES
jgi:hypothetical protein